MCWEIEKSFFNTTFRYIERLVESAGDEEIITTSDRVCVRREFSGNGFRMRNNVYDHMFVSIRVLSIYHFFVYYQ